METQALLLIVVFILGGCFVLLLLSLIPFLNQLRRTARQIEITAASLDSIVNNELKALLTRGDVLLREFEEIPALAKDRITHISKGASRSIIRGVGSQLIRGLILWGFKQGWKKMTSARKRKAL